MQLDKNANFTKYHSKDCVTVSAKVEGNENEPSNSCLLCTLFGSPLYSWCSYW